MSEITEAAARRAAADEQRRDNLIAALEDERRGYVQRGNEHRVKQVDEQLALVRKRPVEKSAPANVDAATTESKVADAAENATEKAPAAETPAKPAAKRPAAKRPAAKK